MLALDVITEIGPAVHDLRTKFALVFTALPPLQEVGHSDLV